MPRILALLACCISLIFCSCGKIMMGAYGVHNYDGYTLQQVDKAARKYGVQPKDAFIMDSLYYQRFGFAKKADVMGRVKDLFQPLQLRIYDTNGKLLAQYANCNVPPGLFNLSWKRYLDTLPPNPKYISTNDTLSKINLQTEFEYVRPMYESNRIASPTSKYYVVIYWSRFMGRQSKHFIKQVYKRFAPYKNQINYIYINTEPLFY
ncbi:MAG: hypothetical protein M0D57_00520 [Sphingobacteriales bacterium JAD_PAG50586_3]|nr:MAG: hypothetical protein M0D57_00520 [Sphingobacteriales bacterium JAD_PAG50586_3]